MRMNNAQLLGLGWLKVGGQEDYLGESVSANLEAITRRLRKAFPVLSRLTSTVISPGGEPAEVWRDGFDEWRTRQKPGRLIELRTELDDLYRMGLRFDEMAVVVHHAFGLDEITAESEGGVLGFLCNLEDRLVEWLIVNMPPDYS